MILVSDIESGKRKKRGAPPLHLWDDEWLGLRTEDVIEPSLPIVDPHHHLWHRHDPYLPSELVKDLTSGHQVRGSVFIECGFMYRTDGDAAFSSIGEVEYVNGVAAAFAAGYYGNLRACSGIVGKVDLTIGSRAGGVLEACLARAPDRFRGIRQMASWDASPEVNMLMHPPPKELMMDKRFREGFAELAPLGLSFDAYCYHPQLPELIDLVDTFPNTRFIINHIGGLQRVGPYRESLESNFLHWKTNIISLAERPNTYVKVGGMGMRGLGFDFVDRDLPPTSEELSKAWQPFAETCIEAFGPDRSMFESNFPVDKASVSYRTLWNTFKRIVSEYSAEEKRDLFARTAINAYRLPEHLGQN